MLVQDEASGETEETLEDLLGVPTGTQEPQDLEAQLVEVSLNSMVGLTS